MGHVTARRGRVDGMEAHGNAKNVRAYVPLAGNVRLRNSSSFCIPGRGTFMMVFDHYEEMYLSQYKEEIMQKTKGED